MPTPQCQIIDALLDKSNQNPETVKAAAIFLKDSAATEGYALILLAIINENNANVLIKHSALLQLKNCIKQNWNRRNSPMRNQQKQQIKDSIMLSFVASIKVHPIWKTYKQILALLFQHQYRSWLPFRLFLQKISIGENVPIYLNALLAMATAFEFSITEEQRNNFFAVIEAVFPVLLQVLQKIQDEQLTYLSIKFFWKAVHYEINAAIKNLSMAWMPLLQRIIGSINPIYDNAPNQIQQKGTNDFFYFHSKKWATRILLRFIQKHAKRITFNRNEDNRSFHQRWYAQFGKKILKILVKQFQINTTKKVRYFQLKCIQNLINDQAELMKQYAEQFQYGILLDYLRIKAEDEKLAFENPVLFIQKQGQPSRNFTQLKTIAAGTWIGFSMLGGINQRRGVKYQPGYFFLANIQFLKRKLSEEDEKQKELALYLICQLSQQIKKCKQIHQTIKRLIMEHAIPNFKSSNMFLRARSLDVFSRYQFIDFIPLEIQFARQAAEGILCCILKEEYLLVRIKALSAFSLVIHLRGIKDQTLPLLKQIFEAILHILQNYGQQITANDMENIVSQYGSHIIPFAYDLVSRLSQIYFKMVAKDNEMKQQKQYDGQFQLAGARCLRTITKIMQCPLPAAVVEQIEPTVLKVVQSIFLEKLNDYNEDVLMLLKVFLYKVKVLSSKAWFYFQAIIYNIIGIPQTKWNKLSQFFPQKSQFLILNSLRKNSNVETLEKSMPVLRNYIFKVSEMKMEPNYEAYKNGLVPLLFHLFSEVYKIGVTQFTGEINLTICSALMVCLIYNFQKSLPQNVYLHIWEFARINILKFKSRNLKSINSQLIGLLLWVDPSMIIVIQRQKLFEQIAAEFIRATYQFEHQRARLILGINSLLLLPQKPSFLIPKLPDLLKANMKLVQANIDKRMKIQTVNQENVEDDHLDLDEDMEEDLWLEDYDDHYNGSLNLVDELWDFEDTLERLSSQQSNLYLQLIRTVPEGNIAFLRQKLRMTPKKNK